MILKAMKYILASLILAAIPYLSTCNANDSSAAQKRKRPIKKETTAIRYTISSNSGIAVQTEYNITSDTVTWHYTDHRNGFVLYDVVKYDRKDFEDLVGILSQVEFKVRHVESIPTSGGGGHAYSFFDSNGRYLGYGVVNNIATGDNKTAEVTISQFLDTHKTAGERAVEEAKEKGALHIDMEEFPETLVPYRVE